MNPSPDFLCGVVEGFYGRPWTSAQRLDLFARLQAWGLNTYLYAPKDDLRHRLRWREPYPAAEAAELAALIAACQRAGLTFVYALAPGLDPEFAAPAGLAALARKFAQIAELGGTHCAVLFDDIVPSPASGLLGASAADAAAQALFAHHLRSLQRQVSPAARLLFCPTPYCGRMSGPVAGNAYLRHLGACLDPAIAVLWTGPEIISEEIPPDSIRELAAVLRRRPVLWDNLFANDYDLRRLYLGPYSGRSLELRGEIAGVLGNPNCEFAANFVPLRTLARWHRATTYDPATEARAAWREWQPAWVAASAPPGQPSAPLPLESLTLLADCFHLPYSHGPRAQAWREDFEWLRQTTPADWGDRFPRFAAECAAIGELFDQLTRLENRELLHTFYRHVWELKEEAQLLLGYLHWRQTSPAPGACYFSAEHRPRTYRGGLVADLQRLLPMGANGGFAAAAPSAPPP